MLPATFLAIPLDWNALDARFEAWLNRSQREKATVFVMVRIRATTTFRQRTQFCTAPQGPTHR